MLILAELHGYPPAHNSGAEWMAHHIFRHLAKNHSVVVLLNFNSYLGKVKDRYNLDGVEVVSDEQWGEWYRKSDVVFTHLDKTSRCYNRCRNFNKPLVHIIHNNYSNFVIEGMNQVYQGAIYNSNWVKEDCKLRHRSIKQSIVIHPPVYIKDYKVKKINDYITLINLNRNKGGDFLIELAKKMTDRKFMGVWGSYGDQKFDNKLCNIHYVFNTPEIKNVYKRTRILIMPSIYESYGRTAIEAAASGIPVICSDTPGLRESIGKAGIYCSRSISEYVEAIKMLDNKEYYDKISKLCLKRARQLNPDNEFERLDIFIKEFYESKSIENTRNESRQRVVFG